jgi:hypothetical protein
LIAVARMNALHEAGKWWLIGVVIVLAVAYLTI